MKKYLITGTAGFIGFFLAKRLAESGEMIIGVDNINDYYDVGLKYARLAETGISEKAGIWGKKVISDKYTDYSFIRLNLEDRERLNELFKKEKFDVVIHLAAQPGVRYSIENPQSYIDRNIIAFHNILEACRHYDVKKLLYASSSSVYGNCKSGPFNEDLNVDHPISLYAATKKSNELMAYTYSHLYKIQTIGLRFFTVYGPFGRPDMAPMLFATAAYTNKTIKVFNHGKQMRDFTYIDDIIEGMFAILKKGFYNCDTYEIFNIGNGNPVELLEFISGIETASNKKIIKEFVDAQAGDVEFTHADVSKIKKHFGFYPRTDVNEGVKKFIHWFKSYYRFTD